MKLKDLIKRKEPEADAEEVPEEPGEMPEEKQDSRDEPVPETLPAEAVDTEEEGKKKEEKPGLLDRIKGWFHKEKPVTLHTIEYVAYESRYVDTIEQMPAGDLPADALKIAGRKNEYLSPRRLTFPAQDPNELTAADLYLFSLQSSLENLMTASGKTRAALDAKTLMTYAAIAIVAICILYALFA